MSYISHRGVDIWGFQCFRFWKAFPVYNFNFNIVCVLSGERDPYFASPGMKVDTLLVRDSTGLWGYMHMLHCQLYSSFARGSCGRIAIKEGLGHINKESQFSMKKIEKTGTVKPGSHCSIDASSVPHLHY